MFTLAELEKVIPLVRASVPPTPQYTWPLLEARTGVEVVVKHENHRQFRTFVREIQPRSELIPPRMSAVRIVVQCCYGAVCQVSPP